MATKEVKKRYPEYRVGTEKGRRTTASTSEMLRKKEGAESANQGPSTPEESKYRLEQTNSDLMRRLRDINAHKWKGTM